MSCVSCDVTHTSYAVCASCHTAVCDMARNAGIEDSNNFVNSMDELLAPFTGAVSPKWYSKDGVLHHELR